MASWGWPGPQPHFSNFHPRLSDENVRGVPKFLRLEGGAESNKTMHDKDNRDGKP